MKDERVLHIRILSIDDAVSEVKQQFAMLDAGIAATPQVPTLSLTDVDALHSLLTPRRIDLLRALRRFGPMSIRALSQRLSRDYKNVHTDTVTLIESGLVERDANSEVATPWDRFEVSILLQDDPVDEAA